MGTEGEKPRTLTISFAGQYDRYPQADDFLISISHGGRWGTVYHVVDSREIQPKGQKSALSTRRFRIKVLKSSATVVGRSDDSQKAFTFSWNGRGRH